MEILDKSLDLKVERDEFLIPPKTNRDAYLLLSTVNTIL